MLIDFHTHAFPDGLAERAIRSLQDGVTESGLDFDNTAYYNGTADGLLKQMDECGVDISVLLPVSTKSSQSEGINRWTKEITERTDRIIPFGAIYPDENSLRNLDKLAESGYKGIKLHGDFQNFYADEPRMIPFYRRCGELGLIVVMHSGIDPASPHDIHTTPERIANILDKVSGTSFVIAHMGGVECEDEAVRLLSGADKLWIDTAFTDNRLSPKRMREYISAFGADRVLFASDTPWNDPVGVRDLLEKSYLTDDEKRKIFSENAVALLGNMSKVTKH